MAKKNAQTIILSKLKKIKLCIPYVHNFGQRCICKGKIQVANRSTIVISAL